LAECVPSIDRGGWELGRLHGVLEFVAFARSKAHCFWLFKDFNLHPDQAALLYLVLYIQSMEYLGVEGTVTNLGSLLGERLEVPVIELLGVLGGFTVANNLARSQDKLSNLLRHVISSSILLCTITPVLEESAQRCIKILIHFFPILS